MPDRAARETKPKPTVSVVSVTHNSADVISAFVDSLPADERVEIVVVDNCSHDHTVEMIRSRSAVRLIQETRNNGYGAAVNRGALAASGDLLLVLNPDAPVLDLNLDVLTGLAQGEKPLGLLGCRIVDGRGIGSFLVRTEVPWPLDLVRHVYTTFLRPQGWGKHSFPPLRIQQRLWVSGAAFLVRRDEFLSVGGFEPTIFMYGEDVQLARVYRDHALPIGTTGAVTVAHSGSGSSDVNAALRATWNALSLVQRVALRSGSASARSAARAYCYTLTTVMVVARAAQRAPFVGSRAAKQLRRAQAVRRELMLLAETDDSSYPWYPEARRTFRVIFRPPADAVDVS